MRFVCVVVVMLGWACGPSTEGARPGAGNDASDAVSADTTTLASDPTTQDGGGETAATDADFDGVDDTLDNCLGLFNPTQVDLDEDDIGDACDDEVVAGDDRDGDSIPDIGDPFPDDAARPGVVRNGTIYVHTSSELYFMELKTFDVYLIDQFAFPSDASSVEMTDIAVDRYGVMYGISFDDVFVIEPTTAQCWRLAPLPQEFNGLTLISKTITGAATDTLVGISNEGGWWRLNLVPTVPPSSQQRVELTFFGAYGGAWQSSGDAFSIEGVGTFATVDQGELSGDKLVRVDPATGAVQSTVADMGFLTQVWGLAGWTDRIFAFDAGGELIVYDIATGAVVSRKDLDKAWWGAGVRTIIDE